MSLSREGIVSFMEQQFSIDAADIHDDTQLFTEGILDSLSLADLLIFVEKEGGFTIAPQEVTLDNLGSVQSILAFVENKSA